jgi:hypothetical protein
MSSQRILPIISTKNFNELLPSFSNYELVEYDTVKYRNNPVESQWEGRKIAAAPNKAIAIIAKKSTDEKGDFITLFLFMPQKNIEDELIAQEKNQEVCV